jgi:glycosyltransferase involved in cell wall biosynthesis
MAQRGRSDGGVDGLRRLDSVGVCRRVDPPAAHSNGVTMEKKTVRVNHVAPLPAGPVGGVGTYMLALLDVLAGGAIDSAVICNADVNPDRLALPPRARAIPAWRFGSARYPRDVMAALSSQPCDLVHVQQELFLYGQGPIALLFPFLLARLRRKYRVVVTVHGVTTDREIDSSLMRGRKSPVPLPVLRAVIVHIFRSIARSRAHLVVHDAVLKERLIALGARPADVTVIAHPLFAPGDAQSTRSQAGDRASLGLPAGAKIVLTWGYWNGYKGLDVLVGGFERFARRNPDALLVLGTGPHPQLRDDRAYMASYDAEMAELSKHPAVHHAGFIAQDALPQYVRAADICAFSYTKYLAASGPATYALTMGAPVIYSSVFADVPDVMKFAPDPAGVDAALQRFFDDPQPFATAARELRDRAGAATLLAQYEELYGGLSE